MAKDFKKVGYLSMESETELTSLHQIDGRLLTHIILAFAKIDQNGNLVLARSNDTKYFNEIKDFKKKYPHIRIMISVNNDQSNEDISGKNMNNQHHDIGQGSNNNGGFNCLIHSVSMRQHFVRSVVDFLKSFSLDGIDLDWEFPNFPNTFINKDYERNGLTKILMELRSAFIENFYDRQQRQLSNQAGSNENYSLSGNRYANNQQIIEPYILTVAIGAQEAILRSSYDLKQLTGLCDWFNVMSYDYYLFKPYAPFTGPNSPLNPIVDHFVPVLGKLSFISTINRLLTDEVEREKIVMGIPTYARGYRLLFKNTHPAPFTIAYTTKGGQIGDHLNYHEVCDILRRPDTIVEYDERAKVPYLLTDDGYTWISFENEQSVSEKLYCILEHHLAGFMTWNLNCDDFSRRRNQENGETSPEDESQFPLHRALDQAIQKFKSIQNNNSKNTNSTNNVEQTNSLHHIDY